jgi:hypothetical protein
VSHAVSYVVDQPGVDFNATSPAWQRASEAIIETLRATESIWDGDLPSGISFTAELTGVLTIIWLTTSYTMFLTDRNRAELVRTWEEAAFSSLSKRVARVDEFLLLQWQNSAGEWWFRDRSLSARFWEWLKGQAPLHWEILQDGKAT